MKLMMNKKRRVEVEVEMAIKAIDTAIDDLDRLYAEEPGRAAVKSNSDWIADVARRLNGLNAMVGF